VTQGKRLPVPHNGGRLSKRYGIAPDSWSGALRRDLNVIATWLLSLGFTDAAKLGSRARQVDGAGPGFRHGSKLMMMVAGVSCTCGRLPHLDKCAIWRKLEIREHMYSTYGITASTKVPPENYMEDVLRFPRAG